MERCRTSDQTLPIRVFELRQTAYIAKSLISLNTNRSRAHQSLASRCPSAISARFDNETSLSKRFLKARAYLIGWRLIISKRRLILKLALITKSTHHMPTAFVATPPPNLTLQTRPRRANGNAKVVCVPPRSPSLINSRAPLASLQNKLSELNRSESKCDLLSK